MVGGRRAPTRPTSCTTPTRSPRSPTRGCAASTRRGRSASSRSRWPRRWRAGGSARSSCPTTTWCSTPSRGPRRAATGTSVCSTRPRPARVVPVPDPDTAARMLPRLGAGAWWPDLDDLLGGIEQVVPDQLVPGSSGSSAEQRVELPRGVGEDLDRRRLLLRRAGGRDLVGRHRDRAERVAQLELRRVDALGHVVPRLAVAGLGRLLATGCRSARRAACPPPRRR